MTDIALWMVYLSWGIAIGSLVATFFTLRRLCELRHPAPGRLMPWGNSEEPGKPDAHGLVVQGRGVVQGGGNVSPQTKRPN
jgi:hypothetical protein